MNDRYEFLSGLKVRHLHRLIHVGEEGLGKPMWLALISVTISKIYHYNNVVDPRRR